MSWRFGSVVCLVAGFVVSGCWYGQSAAELDGRRRNDEIRNLVQDSARSMIQIVASRNSQRYGPVMVRSVGVAVAPNLALVPAHSLRKAQQLYANTGQLNDEFEWQPTDGFPIEVVAASESCDVALVQPVSTGQGSEQFRFERPISLSVRERFENNEMLIFISGQGRYSRTRVIADPPEALKRMGSGELTVVQQRVRASDRGGILVEPNGVFAGLLLGRGVRATYQNFSWFISIDDAMDCLR